MKEVNTTLDYVKCLECETYNDYEMKPTDLAITIKNDDIILTADIPYCKNCGARLEVAEVTNKILMMAKKKHEKVIELLNKEGK